MDKGKKKSRKNKNRNKEAVEFILANRDAEDPNFNNPNVNKKILLQVNKDEDLTEKQKKIIESIPKVERGIFDENAKIKLMTQNIDNNNNNDNNEHKEKKGVSFDFDKNEVINFDKKKKVEELQKDKFINDIRNKKIDISKIEDEEKVKEIFKNLKVNAKIVEYNELGVKKDTDPELLKLITDKEFVEGVDIFVPAPKDNEGKIIEDYDNDMNEENMNEEYKELEKELKSDDEDDKKIKKEENQDNKEKKEEEISTSTKEDKLDEKIDEKKDIEIQGDLEDDFVLLANGGELPVELISEQEKENLEKKKKEEIKQNNDFNISGNNKSYKYITQEEIDYVEKKFLLDDNEENKGGKKKGNFIGKKEFNDAINEILNSKKGKNDKNQIERVMGLKKSILDEEEFEEYELSEEDEELIDTNENKDKEKDKITKNQNIDSKKLKDIISNKKDEKEDKFEEDEEEEEEEEEYKPNIKIEYVSREDEPAPFDKDNKLKKKRKNKKEFKKSRTKQYEQLKANGELSDESFDREKLDELLHDEEYVQKTKELIDTNIEEEKNVKEVDKEIETKYNLEPKIQKDITQTTDKIVNLPKTIKQEKKEKLHIKKEKEEEPKEEKEDNKKINNIDNEKDRKKETKEDKALRKKLLKMERKEKRAEKKKLKNAFKEEKVTQQRQIAQANKIVRYGLSVKDI
jgi:hypothetical protein